MSKLYYFKGKIDVGKCLNDEPIEPIKPHEEPFVNPFINNPSVDEMVDNFMKDKIKDSMMFYITNFGQRPQDIMLRFANCLDEHTRKLAEEAYNELLNEFFIRIV